MREIKCTQITQAVAELFSGIPLKIEDSTAAALAQAQQEEGSELCRFALDILCQNNALAQKNLIPVCQDTGMCVVFAEVGQDVHIVGGTLEEAINAGVKKAYADYRKSVLSPLTRNNTKDNTPAVIHYSVVAGDKLTLHGMSKGFGSENMSALRMLSPSDGIDGVKRFVTETVKKAGGCPCPPILVGVGIGGTMEKCAVMAKHALLRKVGSVNENSQLAELEKHLLNEINRLEIGAGGFGGSVSALAVFIESYPTHIAGLPIAVNIQCHCSRHDTVIL